MQRYVLTIYQPDGEPPGPEVLEPIMRDLDALGDEMRAAGAWLFSGGLRPPGEAVVLDPRGGGEVLTTDGPYTEGKEHIGGFTVIQAPDRDAALAWGRKMAAASTLPIEVREFWG
ncbi:YciI family protein [Nonomuraea rubra]|uniref:YCII-related domain-containing protein n=1 Tax=Nonomuraea rubra TaxID=46180 RepID=A0A7X0U347_9ACTN|nr:YciI family protein [Nonomuraea rubra]MBB6553080.1 hypothetical protein [Nonomuraea rubra]